MNLEIKIKIESLTSLILRDCQSGVVESSSPSVDIRECLGEQPMLRGALLTERDSDPQQVQSIDMQPYHPQHQLLSQMLASHEKGNVS
jgi:hypothetical protein